MSRALKALCVILLAAGLLVLAGRLNRDLYEKRAGADPQYGQSVEGAPPLVAFVTIALGGFRGIIADLLWLRAGEMQDQGRYFEVVQLADWITKLEPQFPTVWAFHAWNMAYNISALMPDDLERWRWVRNGITLLRDNGLRYNSRSPVLHRELGWLFQHKLAQAYDAGHLYYKRMWAAEMGRLWPGPRPDYAALPAAVAAAMRQEYKLDPQRMREVEERFGALDWRLPQAHAIYWACQGLPGAEGFDRIALSRMIYQSLMDVALNGTYLFDPGPGTLILLPNPAVIPKAEQFFKDVRREWPELAGLQAAQENFYYVSMRAYFLSGQFAQAQEMFERFRATVPTPALTGRLEDILCALLNPSMEPWTAVAAARQAAQWEATSRRLAELGWADNAAGTMAAARLIRQCVP